ncbi:MAG: potassium transporter Kup [Alphaproteobacteria bacterium]|nr:potassium transporter Kup [Alphaproteobacteria bacterium]
MTTPSAVDRGSPIAVLMLGAIGIVFGDIGTSPLYAVKETFAGPHPLPIDPPHVLGVLSLVFWSIMCIVSIKYVIVIMRADNRGEGGSLALFALARRAAEGKPAVITLLGILGVFAAALFYGDSMITPAISVLSAVEGLNVVEPGLKDFILPISAIILLFLFLIQKHGTALVGFFFAPVMVAWFVVLAWLGIRNIALFPKVLAALSPHYALMFIATEGFNSFLALGSVVLAVTGAEALYSDMGHFGRWPIRLAWYLLVLPALILNYFGQGALLLVDPSAVENPFFNMAPDWAGLPLVVLATAATIIASQAVISGAFSVTRQAIQLGYLPRMTVHHTSAKEIGQIYVPFLNWTLMIFVLALVFGFRNSSSLASAYGVAVTGTMLIDTLLVAIVMALLWKWRRRIWMTLIAAFLILDLAFFSANSLKIVHGGWFPLAIGVIIFVLLTTWKQGRDLTFLRREETALTPEGFVKSLSERVVRVPGTAIYFSGAHEKVPAALLHNMKHNKVLHERVVLLNVETENIPFVGTDRRIESLDFGDGVRGVTLRFGYLQSPDIPKTMANATFDQLGFFYDPMTISYFLSRTTILPSRTSPMPLWREALYAWMVRSSASAMEFFQLPSNRVVELGSQIEI